MKRPPAPSTPVRYDPRDWVRQAKAAGMKYMVLTSKHHDGFALFETRASDWNAVDASGIRRDLIKEYVDACHEAGMRVGYYYSHEKDWWHHAKMTRDPSPLSQEYIDFVMTQIEELFTNYGTIDLIWFDTPMNEHREFNERCAALVRELQPDCIVNGRIGNNLGDYRNIGDRAIIPPGERGYIESIMTMRLNWGYDRNDDFWKSSRELIHMVSSSACRGSNFLLNIGPTPEGTFPPEDQVRLRDLGIWMGKNGESIYATKGSPFAKEYPWGSLTSSAERKAVYLHLHHWTGGAVQLTGLATRVRRAAFLDTGEAIDFEQERGDGALHLPLPAFHDGKTLRIVKLHLEEAPAFDPNHGPDFLPPPVQHVTHANIEGRITREAGLEFRVTGKHIRGSRQGAQFTDDRVSTVTLSLNDHVRYRINAGGDIRAVQGFELEEGATYRVVYSPFKDQPVTEIITRME
jgi:alpha-L-fucosidase